MSASSASYLRGISACAAKPSASCSTPLGNKPFAEKKGTAGSGRPCYAESPFFAERELANLPDWDVKQLIDRRQRLIDWALERWHVKLDEPRYVPAVPASAGEPEDLDVTDESGAADELGGRGG